MTEFTDGDASFDELLPKPRTMEAMVEGIRGDEGPLDAATASIDAVTEFLRDAPQFREKYKPMLEAMESLRRRHLAWVSASNRLCEMIRRED